MKKTLCSLDIEQSRCIAAVRIHAERVIGIVRNKHSLLQLILPLDFLMKKDDRNCYVIDNIVCLACGLVNLCDSVISSQ